MNWRLLIKAGKAFDEIEQTFPDPSAYDSTMRSLNSGSLPQKEEVRKIYAFMNKWFSRAAWKSFDTFCERYQMAWNNLSALSSLALENTSPEDVIRINGEQIRVTRAIHFCFDCLSLVWKVGSTPASKALHMTAPGLLVMWDTPIRNRIAHGSSGYHYAYIFLPTMKRNVDDVIQSYIRETNCDSKEAVAQIQKERGKNYTLAKMIDEFNWVTITKGRRLG